jgi:two-component system nitrogen regulation response regulator GlnG
VDGLPFDGVQEISSEELQRGVVLSLNDRVLLLLHSAPELRLTGPDFDLIGRGQAMFATRAAIGQVADLDVPVLIRGESGTGKELVARALHLSSPRHRGPFVAVNMGAINPSTALSELFGHIKGAFTGANSDRVGLFSQADGGTLFLDEIGEAPAEVQVMLLRCLEDGLIRPVGSDQPRSVDVRVVAATDRDLELATQDGTFRGPLLHRLSGFQIPLAPLRSRREDLGLLLHTFLRRELSRLGTPDQLARPLSEVLWLRAQLVERLVLADWPGNVRQLANVARQIVIGSRGLEAAELSDSILAAQESPASALAPVQMPGLDEATPSTARVRPEELQESSLLSALREEEFMVAAAARRLGISRTSLYALMEKSPNVRKARDLTEADIRAALDGGAHGLRAAASQLEVSERGLRLRMTELGLH